MSIDRTNSGGRLTERIYIEQPVIVADTFGQAQYGPQAAQGNWTLVYECWAAIQDEYGLEQKQSAHEVSEEWVVVQVRWAQSIAETIQPNMRIRHKHLGNIYDIRSVLIHVDGQRKMIEMNCVAVT